jgi:hypothetical protein
MVMRSMGHGRSELLVIFRGCYSCQQVRKNSIFSYLCTKIPARIEQAGISIYDSSIESQIVLTLYHL